MRRTLPALPALLLLLACGAPKPRAIAYGSEACHHCHMTVADPRFSAELLTRTGKAITFDDIGCMAAWLAENPTEGATGWVVSFVDGGWLRADSVTFLKSEQFQTPMASGLIALRPGAEADSVHRSLGGELLDWSTVRRESAGHGHSPSAS
jgi:copper chaperone NosL